MKRTNERHSTAMIRIAICDNDTAAADMLADSIKTLAATHRINCEIHCFSKGLPLLYEIEDNIQFDLFFLETQLPDMDGLLLAQKIKKLQPDCLFLFVSNETAAVYDAFQLPAFRFLPKMQLSERLEEAFLSATSQLKAIHSQYYVIQSGAALERIPLHRIVYIVREGNYCVFQDETDKQYRVRSSLKSVHEQLPTDQFIYINQIICNVSHIDKIEGDTVFLSNGSRINAAKGSVRKIKNTLLRFWADTSLVLFGLLFAQRFYRFYKLFNAFSISNTQNNSSAALKAGLPSSACLDLILLFCFAVCFLVSLFVRIHLINTRPHSKQ